MKQRNKQRTIMTLWQAGYSVAFIRLMIECGKVIDA